MDPPLLSPTTYLPPPQINSLVDHQEKYDDKEGFSLGRSSAGRPTAKPSSNQVNKNIGPWSPFRLMVIKCQ